MAQTHKTNRDREIDRLEQKIHEKMNPNEHQPDQNSSFEKWGKWLLYIGLFCILAAVIFFGLSQYRNHQESERSREILAELKQKIDDAQEPDLDYTLVPEKTLPVTEIDQTDFCGIFSAPVLNIEEPVKDEWGLSPFPGLMARYRGTPYMKNFQIGSAKSSSWLSELIHLNPGDQVSFTDLDSNTFTYQVTALEEVKSYQFDLLDEWNWDMVIMIPNDNDWILILTRQVAVSPTLEEAAKQKEGQAD